jgi:hypothetical protein
MFHLVFLVMALAGLAVMYRLVVDFVRAAAVPYGTLKTPEGKTYYFNVRTNATVWAVPAGGVIVHEDTCYVLWQHQPQRLYVQAHLGH